MSSDSQDSHGSRGLAIEVRNLSKLYRRTSAGHQLRTLKSALLDRSLVRHLNPAESIPAVRGVSFTITRGEAVGLIGSNGSGKSTLLKMAAGILRPTEGEIRIEGRVAALIELGAGFHPEISGRENIFINGAVLGLSRKQIEKRYDEIVEFSGLGDFIDEPVKNYSSGMYVRLGFAVAVHTDPDVLMVDEVLSVGDEAFGHRCLRRIEEMLAEGKTLLLVSHSLGLIEEVCDRAIWLEKGELRVDGHPRRVIDAYRESVAKAEGEAHRQAIEDRGERTPVATDNAGDASDDDAEGGEGDNSKENNRWGSRVVDIQRLRVTVGGEERYHLHSGDDVVFEIEASVKRPLDDFVFGISIQTPRGVVVWGSNTELEGFKPGLLEAGERRVQIRAPNLRLAPGEYLIDIAAHAEDGAPYDYRRKLAALSVTATDRGGDGLYFPEHSWLFGSGITWQSTPDQDA